MNFSREQLNKYVEKGLLSVQVHPTSPDICIYNYTPKCQYEKIWDDVTMRCRGLIIDWREDKILSNPLPKFFNYEEHIASGKTIPTQTPIVYEKMDGWLGILYWLDGEPWIATRGSFTSTGAVWATEWFRKNVNWEILRDREIKEHGHTYTHLFEIISPITKIVLNYDFEGLVYLASRCPVHGGDVLEVDLPFLKFAPEKYTPLSGELLTDQLRSASIIPFSDYETLKNLEKPNEEGFVLFWPTSSLRLKIKFEEYKRLHKIITGVSEIGIWEILKDGKSVDPLLEKVPDEFYNWVNLVVENLKYKYQEIEKEADNVFGNIHPGMPRKEQAMIISKSKYPGVCFAMLDEKDYSQIIWKMIRPHGSSVFKKDN